MKPARDLIRIHFDETGNFNESPTGRYFLDQGNGAFIDMTRINILGCHVDAVRQLYRGVSVRRSSRCSKVRIGLTLLVSNGHQVG